MNSVSLVSHKRDASKPIVMAVDYLKQKAVNQIPDEQAQKIANEDGIQYSDVYILELDFKGKMLNGNFFIFFILFFNL